MNIFLHHYVKKQFMESIIQHNLLPYCDCPDCESKVHNVYTPNIEAVKELYRKEYGPDVTGRDEDVIEWALNNIKYTIGDQNRKCVCSEYTGFNGYGNCLKCGDKIC